MRRFQSWSAHTLALGLVLGHFAPSAHADWPTEASQRRPSIPDIELVDQHGRKVHFYRDLIKDHTFAINFVFTSCTTICPLAGATFGKLQTLVGSKARLISVSIDPEVDTPARLLAWGARSHAGANWTLLTGRKENVDMLRKALAVYTPDIGSHAPVVVLGNDSTGEWTRADALTPAAKLAEQLEALSHSPAHRYFTDTPLVDQHGVTHHFYRDLIAGKVVVIDAFFTGCHASCPLLAARFARIQAALGDQLERDVRLISISLDPEHDTPARLREYAAQFKAKPGWYFLTGDKANVELVLQRLGEYVPQKEGHLDLVLVGNDRTGMWKKALGQARPEEIIAIVQSVVKDRSE